MTSATWPACSAFSTCSSIPSKTTSCWPGPAKAGKLNAQGEVVGRDHGPARDVAGRFAGGACADRGRCSRRASVARSIPRNEGLVRLQALIKNRPAAGDDPQPVMAAIEQALGPQTISVTGVPDTSHFARVLVAADYRMKRLAMGFESRRFAGCPAFCK